MAVFRDNGPGLPDGFVLTTLESRQAGVAAAVDRARTGARGCIVRSCAASAPARAPASPAISAASAGKEIRTAAPRGIPTPRTPSTRPVPREGRRRQSDVGVRRSSDGRPRSRSSMLSAQAVRRADLGRYVITTPRGEFHEVPARVVRGRTVGGFLAGASSPRGRAVHSPTSIAAPARLPTRSAANYRRPRRPRDLSAASVGGIPRPRCPSSAGASPPEFFSRPRRAVDTSPRSSARSIPALIAPTPS